MQELPQTETRSNRKPPSEEELFELLRSGQVSFPPARLRVFAEPVGRIADLGTDGLIEVLWSGQQVAYSPTYKRTSSPRALDEAIAQASYQAGRTGSRPLILVPYLSEATLLKLDERGISGMDLCGNGLLIAPDFRLWRSGQPNRYRDTRPIRNPFQGDSSVFARAFLLKDTFPSLRALQEFAHARTYDTYHMTEPAGLAQSTASKVVHALIDELVVRKVGSELRLADLQRLIYLLRGAYGDTARASLVGTTSLDEDAVWALLAAARSTGGVRAVTTGVASAGHYGVLSGVEKLSLYVDDVNAAATLLQVRPGRAFANIRLYEDRKNLVYFDARPDGDVLWASPIQTWLELASAGPREQEAAEMMERSFAPNEGDGLH